MDLKKKKKLNGQLLPVNQTQEKTIKSVFTSLSVKNKPSDYFVWSIDTIGSAKRTLIKID